MNYKFRGSKAPKRQSWARGEIIGDQAMLEESFELTSEYLYKILDYADKEEPIPVEEVEKARAIFAFAKQGPRAAYFRLANKEKLVSADVLYMLTSSLPATKIADKFNINPEIVRRIRQGVVADWYWEYFFVRRMKTIIKHGILQSRSRKTEVMYSVSKINDDMTKSILLYTTSKRKAVALRESIITNKKDYDKMIKNNTLDILYPIDKLEVLK